MDRQAEARHPRVLRESRVRTAWSWLAAVLCVQGLSWVVWGSFEPTGWYDGLLAESQLGVAELPSDAARVFAFALVPFGATDAAYFALVWGLVRHAFHEDWALRWVAGSFFLWMSVDTLGCAVLGAWFNILVVNVPCVLVVGAALLAWRWALHTATLETA